MAEDWAIDVKKYVPDADDSVIAAIVRHCGIALRSRDASLVAFSDPAETGRVRDGYCRKKLALTDPDPVLDAAIAKVGERMQADRTKNRVTVYYLLAEAFGKLGLFGAVAAATPAMAAEAPVAAAPVVEAPVVAAPVMAAAIAAAPIAAAPLLTTGAPARVMPEPDRGFAGTALVVGGIMAVILIGAGLVGTLVGSPVKRIAVVAPTPPVVAAPAPVAATTTVTTTVAIPAGAGVTAQEVEGKPAVSVYFDTAKTDIAPDFATIAAPIKAYVDSHPGARVTVSGFNDPRGNAALNAELSKNRAKAVRAALVLLAVPLDAIDLVKPADTTDADTSQEGARRVDIVVHDAN